MNYGDPHYQTWGLFILTVAIIIGLMRNRKASIAVGLLIMALVAAHVFRIESQNDPRFHEQLIGLFAFITSRYTETSPYLMPPGGRPAMLWSPFTYALLHGDGGHLFGNAVLLFVFGRSVAWRIGSWRFLLLFAASAAAGAMVYLIFSWGEPGVLIGASGGCFGIMAATFRFVPRTDDRLKALFWPDEKVRTVALLSLREMLTERRSLVYMLYCLVIYPLGLLALLYGASGNIAVTDHLGGFAMGLFGVALLDRRRQVASPEASVSKAGETLKSEPLGLQLLRAGFLILVVLGVAGGLSYYLMFVPR